MSGSAGIEGRGEFLNLTSRAFMRHSLAIVADLAVRPMRHGVNGPLKPHRRM